MSEAETYNFVTSEKRGRGYGSGVHKEYTFVDDPEVVAETLQADIRLEQAEHEENLVKSVVNAQIDDFFRGKLTRRDTDSDTEFISHTVCSISRLINQFISCTGLSSEDRNHRTRGCDSGRSSTSTISPSGLRSRSWQLTTGSRYVEARYTTVNICVVTSIGREPVKGLREDVVEDDRFWEGAVVGVIYYCFDYLSQNHHRFRRLALNEDMEYEVGSAESVSTAVVRAVSAVDGRKPSSLPTAIACSRSGRA